MTTKRPHKILIAPDSYKGSLSAWQFCQTAEQAILAVNPDAEIDTLPLADGGEGSVDAIIALPGATKVYCDTVDALGKPIQNVYYAYFHDKKTAFIEMASAAGLYLIDEDDRNPFLTQTYGVGIIIKDAIDRGATHIILGLGGSSSNDGGIGCLAALGIKFVNSKGQAIELNNKGLSELADISMDDLNFDAKQTRFTIACDINNPLCGPNGASYIFAKQKGAKENDLPQLDNNLQHFANIAKSSQQIDIANKPGSGAAGGMGAGLLLLGAKLAPGFDIIHQFLGLTEQIKTQQYDFVITGEGELNEQSQFGKVPVSLAKLIRTVEQKNTTIIAICGAVSLSAQSLQALKLNAAFSICSSPMALSNAMQKAEPLLYNAVQNCYQLFSSKN